MTEQRLFLTASGALGGVFLLSLALYLLVPGSLTRTVLHFPDEVSHRLDPEVRALAFTWDREHNVELLAREILLGPAVHNHLRLLARTGAVRTVLVRGGTVYLDLTKASFAQDLDVVCAPELALEVLRKTLKDNFPGLEAVKVSVEGEPVPETSLTKDKASI